VIDYAGMSFTIYPSSAVCLAQRVSKFAGLYPVARPVATQKRRLFGSRISSYNSENSVRRSCKYSLVSVTRFPKVPHYLSCSVGDTEKHHLPSSPRKVIHHRLVFSPANTGSVPLYCLSVALYYLNLPHSVLDTSGSFNSEIYSS
jgi:hypothetical protein